MNLRRHRLLASLLSFFVLLTAADAYAKKPQPPPDHWVGTWAAAPMALASKADAPTDIQDTTYREIVHVSLPGPLTRIILTNEFGTDPLLIGEVHIALSAGGGAISLMSSNALTFSGRKSITIPAGALAVSDPVALNLPAFADLAVTIFLPAQTIHQVTGHGTGLQTNFVAPGNLVNQVKLPDAKEVYSWFFLKGVDVKVHGTSASVVCLGDSITDGSRSSRDANARWPDNLARRLAGNKSTRELGVLNEGIGGNRVLHDGTAQSALARFDRDVLSQAAVKYLIFMESINDIGHAEGPTNPSHDATAEDLIAAFTQMAERAHIHGIKVIGVTLTPYTGANYSSPSGEAIRQAVNQWIRTSPQLDGFIDFDKAAQDHSNPAVFAAAADSGDHLHPTDAGFKIMVDSIDLKLFTQPKEKYDITRQP
jgi:lysophospholipase L1-like esterase